MPKLSYNDILHRFESESEFNELFDAFEQALAQRFHDLDLYKKLFWNKSLSSDEVILFAIKLNQEFPVNAYDVYMFLGEMFSIVISSEDNYDHALQMYHKAALVRPHETEPYLKAASYYDPDIKIPPLEYLIAFLKSGTETVLDPKPLYLTLSNFYDYLGNAEMVKFYTFKANEGTEPPPLS